MYSVDLYSRVRRACHVDGMSKSAAARLSGAARPEREDVLTPVDELAAGEFHLRGLSEKARRARSQAFAPRGAGALSDPVESGGARPINNKPGFPR